MIPFVAAVMFVAAGVVSAAGNGDQCDGSYTEYFDVATQTWKYDINSFNCEGPCPGGMPSNPCTGELHNQGGGNSWRVCGCYVSPGNLQFDQITVNGEEVRKCQTKEISTPVGGWTANTSAACVDPCASGVCQVNSESDYWVGDVHHRKRSCGCL